MLRELFINIVFDDKIPSQLLRHMTFHLVNHNMAESISRRLRLDKLPATTEQILTTMIEDT